MAVPDLRSNSHYMSKLPTSTQASGRSNFEELAWPCVPPAVVIGEQNFTADQQRSLYYRQPYSVAMSSLNPPVPLFPNHPAIHEPILPKFPPQMFEIPDIQDSNSVFNEGSFQVNAGVARPVPLHHTSFEPSAAAPPSVCRTLLPFPGEWRPPNYISVAAAAGGGGGGGADGGADGSTNSSPLVHNEENNGYDVPMSLPLTQQQNVYSSSTAKTPIKKAKSPKKRKRKDPNEPQKPVSAYSLFFRNAQSAIKTQNPNATFGDISKIVASMWDNLDNEIKRFYKRQMEVAKKEYLKQLAVYRANLSAQESEGRSANSKEESEQPQQQTKVSSSSSSSSSSSVSSSLLPSHGDESTSQGPSVSEVQTQDHSSTVLHQRPPSVETSVHRLPISHQAMTQHQPPPPPLPVYFKEMVPGGLSPLRNGGVYGVPTNVLPAMSQNMFQSYDNKRTDYFGPGIGISPNHYVDNCYTPTGMWNHSLQNDNYTPKCHNWTLWPK